MKQTDDMHVKEKKNLPQMLDSAKGY